MRNKFLMAGEDFDVQKLAEYLHLTPPQISRLADRGKLPGRKIGGNWRFSRAEIHHWLEERIGVSDEDELVQYEGVLERADRPTGRDVPSIAALLPAEAIAIPLNCRTRNSVIRGMVQLAADTGLLWDTEKVVDAVLARETLHPTALDNGVALLHPRRPMAASLSQAVLAFGRTHQGVPFGGRGGCLTDLFFLICSVDDRGHLRTLARLSRLVADGNFLASLREVDDSHEALRLIAATESALDE